MREARKERNTRETSIRIDLRLDGSGTSSIETGIGFFDHMLASFARHGLFDLTCICDGDLEVDTHHTIEDVGIVLGETFAETLGDKSGIHRFGQAVIPMDDALVLCAIDLSGRAYCDSRLVFPTERCGEMELEMIHEFFQSFAQHVPCNLHIRQMGGVNSHHIAEAAFKAFGRALSEAVSLDPRVQGVPSTKGSLS